ncbi:hypothetical protein Salat_2029600 [Sesamum alatum]|uniref:Secreted protein n=1 Tax=Sesamum alatum TaxID=300844 RepID=A0AAE1XZ67_9LAMI|nr:hypothetical protein Salat_2029600 [Sesamum alatum]
MRALFLIILLMWGSFSVEFLRNCCGDFERRVTGDGCHKRSTGEFGFKIEVTIGEEDGVGRGGRREDTWVRQQGRRQRVVMMMESSICVLSCENLNNLVILPIRILLFGFNINR